MHKKPILGMDINPYGGQANRTELLLAMLLGREFAIELLSEGMVEDRTSVCTGSVAKAIKRACRKAGTAPAVRLLLFRLPASLRA